MGGDGRLRRYHLGDNAGVTPPAHERVVRSLSDAELEDEILARRGEADYQAALVAEAERRAATPPVPS